MQGGGGLTLKDFKRLCGEAYNLVRARGNLLINMFILMVPAGMPELLEKVRAWFIFLTLSCSSASPPLTCDVRLAGGHFVFAGPAGPRPHRRAGSEAFQVGDQELAQLGVSPGGQLVPHSETCLALFRLYAEFHRLNADKRSPWRHSAVQISHVFCAHVHISQCKYLVREAALK